MNNIPTLIEIIIQILKNNPDQSFTAKEVAENIFKEFPDWCENKRKRSKQDLSEHVKFISQLKAEVDSKFPILQKREPNYQIFEERPRKIIYSTENIKIKKNKSASVQQVIKKSLSESDLYPLLAEYLHTEHTVYGKRIDEKRSKNSRGSGGNKWLFPDMVGLEITSESWLEAIRNFSKNFTSEVKLWSFEVKKKIDNSNVREVFFQTVSNSSWANYGYLVASKITEETIKELRILAGLHGIGVIRLDIYDIKKSEIIFSARERTIDWNNANRLAVENTDFKDYIVDIDAIYKNSNVKERIIRHWLKELDDLGKKSNN